MRINISLSSYLENTGIGQVLQQYKGKGMYVHFTRIQKLGVNSKKFHADPLGIYFYPIDWILANEKRLDAHGQEKTLYSQYATTYPFYYIVKIDHKFPGVNLDTMTLKQAETLAKEGGFFEKIKDVISNNPAKLFFEAWAKATQAKQKTHLKLAWVEDSKGVINQSEPCQILVRDIRCIKIVDHGETKAKPTLNTYFRIVTKVLGKPTKIESKKDKGVTTNFRLEYKVFADFNPLVINIYAQNNYNGELQIAIETLYSCWQEGWWHDELAGERKQGLITRWVNNSVKIEMDDPNEKLISFLEKEYEQYKKLDNLVENDYLSRYSDHKADYLNKDFDRELNYPEYLSKFCENKGLKSKFAIDYFEKRIAERMANISIEDLLKEFPFGSDSGLEIYQDNLQFGDKVPRTAIRAYRELKKYPTSIFNKFKADLEERAKRVMSEDEVTDMFNQLES